jgi:hypothetical protein
LQLVSSARCRTTLPIGSRVRETRTAQRSGNRGLFWRALTAWKSKSAALGAVAVVFALAVLAAKTGEQDAARAPRPEMADDKRWPTVAPGQVEQMAAPVMDVIAQVLVKVNDKVFAGEPNSDQNQRWCAVLPRSS